MDGLVDYQNRMQANNAYHPAVQRYMNSAQNTYDKAPSVQAVTGITPGPMSDPQTTNTHQAPAPDQPGQLPNGDALAGAAAAGPGNAVGGNTAASAQNPDNLSNPVQAPTVQHTNLDDPNSDPIAQMGRGADMNTNLMIQNARRQQAAQNNQYSGISNSNIPVGNVDGFAGDQLQNAQAIINIGKARGMSRDDIQTALMTALDESGLKNLNYGDADSLGLFQQRPSQGWGSAQQVMDPTYATNKFFDALAGVGNRGALTPWQAAQAVQRSFDPEGNNYRAQFGRAQQLMSALYDQQANRGAMTSPTMKANGSLQWINNETNKYLDYDHAYGAQCVDLYAFYTTGFVGGQAPPVGYAQEIWNNYDPHAYVRVDRTQTPQMGDVAIWGMGGSTPFSHVGIVTQDNGNGTLRTLSNNATSQGPNGNSAIVDIAKGSLLGYLRPRKLM